MSDYLQLNQSNNNKPINEIQNVEASNIVPSIVAHVTTPLIPTPAKKIERATCHKRPSNASENCSKRAKQGAATSPQLLQQLMSPNSKNGKIKSQSLMENGKWTQKTHNIPLQQQTNNSVLMNLLVSGCDVSYGYTCLPRPSKVTRV